MDYLHSIQKKMFLKKIKNINMNNDTELVELFNDIFKIGYRNGQEDYQIKHDDHKGCIEYGPEYIGDNMNVRSIQGIYG